MKALRAIDAEVGEKVERRLILYPFSDRLLVEGVGKTDDRSNHMLIAGLVREVTHEFDIDLEIVDGQMFEVVEAVEAGAEVVKRKLATKGDQSLTWPQRQPSD